MALRCLYRLTNVNHSSIKSPAVLSTILNKNFSLFAKKNEIFSHLRSSINYANVRSKYDKKSSGASSSSAMEDEVSSREPII